MNFQSSKRLSWFSHFHQWLQQHDVPEKLQESTGFPEVASAVLLQRSIWLVRSDDVIITVE
jgi:uncharacterized protein YcgL (UPF0745 family)